MEKYCRKCQKTKDVSEFSKDKKKKDGLQVYCKPCSVISTRASQKKNPEICKRASENLKKRSRDHLRIYFKDHPCVDCNISDIRVLEFDHVRGKKKYTITYLLKHGSLGKLKEEIAKCEVRCANCHRIKSQEEVNSWRTKL